MFSAVANHCIFLYITKRSSLFVFVFIQTTVLSDRFNGIPNTCKNMDMGNKCRDRTKVILALMRKSVYV